MNRNIIFLSILILFIFFSETFSQPGNYYNSISTSSITFISDLKSRIRTPYNRISYDQFDETNIANFASIDNGNGTKSVFCVYSGYEYIYSGTFTWVTLSREHTWAHSWMPTYPSTNNDQYSDQFLLFPTHNTNANNRRSNHPFGIVQNVTYQFLEGKLGTNSLGEIVYEPRDKHKGDAARALLYACIRYDDVSGNTWNFNWLNGTKLPSLGEDSQSVAVLTDWNKIDPPDKYEVERCDYVQSVQLNRNPFTDHPEYVSFINFHNLSKLNPLFANEPDNYPSSFGANVSNSNINLSWSDATGSQLPSGYLLIAYDYDNYFIPIDGSVYSDDTNLNDGYALINIPFNDPNNYSFNNLPTNKSYYFTLYSYNGSGSQINYKTNGTFPNITAFIPPLLAEEPSNHAEDLSAGSISSASIQIVWNDALPGLQAPSGYLIAANNDNNFILPSDGTYYSDDINLSDGDAVVNVNYASVNNYTFYGLNSNTNYYFRIYSYNGNSAEINYKTDGQIPYLSAATSNSSSSYSSNLLDNFNRPDNNVLGNTLLPETVQWQETETVTPGSLSVSFGRIKAKSTTAGREFAFINHEDINGYPLQLNASSSPLVWAFNIRQSRSDPSGFDGNNYGIGYVIGKSSSDFTSGSGYAFVLGQSGSSDPVRLTKFTGGINTNAKFANLISGGDYSNQYLSVKIVFNPSGSSWTLFVDSSSAGFPHADPRNATTQIGSVSDNSYTSTALMYSGAYWNHATGANDSAVFDDVVIPGSSPSELNLKIIIEGIYNNSTDKLNLKDTLTTELRNSASPYNIVDSAVSTIDSNSFIGLFSFPNLQQGNYFISAKYRNGVETWSKLPVTFNQGALTEYDFTNAIDKAYGNNLVLKSSRYCIYSGDTDQNGIIDASDLSGIDNDASQFVTGYLNTDLNGDLIIDASDALIAENNAANFISKITP